MPDFTNAEPWPSLPLEAWSETYATWHLWSQIVGKVRLAQTPWLNHAWHATLYVTARGLTTSPIPHGSRTFEIGFDFVDHRLTVQTSDGGTGGFALEPMTVATFYARLLQELGRLGVPVQIHRTPNEVPDPIPFDLDDTHRAYHRDTPAGSGASSCRPIACSKPFAPGSAASAARCISSGAHPILLSPGSQAARRRSILAGCRTCLTGSRGTRPLTRSAARVSGPAVVRSPTRSSTRMRIPSRPVCAAAIRPREAFYSPDFHEFVLAYDVVRQAESPDDTLLEFLQTTYEAAAGLGGWDRAALERGADPKNRA